MHNMKILYKRIEATAEKLNINIILLIWQVLRDIPNRLQLAKPADWPMARK
jgi:hypothetical protein